MLALVVVVGCDMASSSTGPSPSLVNVDFSPLPSVALPSLLPTKTPTGSTVIPSWPVGWDTSFCTAFSDLNVDHELVIDIERAIADGSPGDAQGLASQLVQTSAITSSELTKLKAWAPAASVQASLVSLIDLDGQVGDAYQSYFKDSVKGALKQARQLRTQVGKQVGPINTQLGQLAGLGLSCPGQGLKLESF